MDINGIDLIVLFLSGSGLLICFVFGISLVLRKDGIRLTNYLLGALLILYSLTTLNGLLALTGVLAQNQHLYFLPIIFNLSIAPLFYLFIRSKTDPVYRLTKKSIPHFIIPGLQFLFYLSIGFRDAEFKSMIWREVLAPYGNLIEEALFIALGAFYLVKVFKLLAQPKSEEWKLPVYHWLKRFTIFFTILGVFHAGYDAIGWISWELTGTNIFNGLWSTLPLKLADILLSFLIGYNAFLYQNQSLIIPRRKSTGPDLEQEFNHLLKEEKIYLNPELDVSLIAKRIGVHRNDVSSYLSEKGTTFRGIINQLRVDEFIERSKLTDSYKYSMLGLALMSGFNSKASFNRIFKETTGETPSAFVKRSQNAK